MKKFNRNIALVTLFPALLLLSGCDHDIAITSDVHEDGSLDRTIMLQMDSDAALPNFMDVSTATGWQTSMERKSSTAGNAEKNDRKRVVFSKHFGSVADANADMDGKSDTLFHVMSTFEKKNRWFYTYIDYSDTYRALDRFKGADAKDYFTEEDFSFIERLPAEGKPISKADKLYLDRLNEKIFDIYGTRSIFEELFSGMLSTLREYKVAPQWTDSLTRKKEEIYSRFIKEDGVGERTYNLLDGGDKKETDDGLIAAADYLKIPLPEAARADLRRQYIELEPRLNVISFAYTGKFLHAIRMPWSVVSTNADSVNGNQLFWKPPVTKFLLKDYTMTARARKLNLWAVVISGLVVLATLALFFARPRARRQV
ncbi:MAG TPA: hypothetical protein VFI14_06335 [Chryseosolibacter sp.]|nr:hypothetical protein [Chryseosolibacter sp.]